MTDDPAMRRRPKTISGAKRGKIRRDIRKQGEEEVMESATNGLMKGGEFHEGKRRDQSQSDSFTGGLKGPPDPIAGPFSIRVSGFYRNEEIRAAWSIVK